MTVTVDIQGPYRDENGNEIVGTPKVAKNASVVFKGKNCRLVLGHGVKLDGARFLFDCDGGFCKVGARSQYKGNVRIGIDCKVEIGEDLTITANCYISTAERTRVKIGNDCMFATNNEIRTDDAHPIYDKNTRQRLNKSRNITIGDHVWLATQAVVLGGATVGSGSVIGYRSTVKSSIPADSLAVGTPARVMRGDVAWERDHLTLSEPYFFPGVEPPPPPPPPPPPRTFATLAMKMLKRPGKFFGDSPNSTMKRIGSLPIWWGREPTPRKP